MRGKRIGIHPAIKPDTRLAIDDEADVGDFIRTRAKGPDVECIVTTNAGAAIDRQLWRRTAVLSTDYTKHCEDEEAIG